MTAALFIMLFSFRYFYRSAYPVKYQSSVELASSVNAVPVSLIYAVIRTESGFNPSAVSGAEATGLMQIRKDTFDWVQYRLGEEPAPFEILFDGETNIRYGVALLSILINEFGSVENAVCAYHAGWGSVKSWLNNPDYSPDGFNIENIPFGDTRQYLQKVMQTKKIYETLYPE